MDIINQEEKHKIVQNMFMERFNLPMEFINQDAITNT